jgi:hypothetical protein
VKYFIPSDSKKANCLKGSLQYFDEVYGILFKRQFIFTDFKQNFNPIKYKPDGTAIGSIRLVCQNYDYNFERIEQI